uniref:Uncharacterized protein n=1 Tax=Oryza rufipogon TaxID=4529 RepID=A0A0E0RGS6_ORYRU
MRSAGAALPSPRATPRNLAPPTRLASPRNPPTSAAGDHGDLPRWRRWVRLRVSGAVAHRVVAGVPAQHYLDRVAPHTAGRWAGTLVAAAVYALRVYYVQGF